MVTSLRKHPAGQVYLGCRYDEELEAEVAEHKKRRSRMRPRLGNAATLLSALEDGVVDGGGDRLRLADVVPGEIRTSLATMCSTLSSNL